MTSPTTSLALTKPPVAVATTRLDVMQLGQVLAGSGYFKDARDASQAIVKVLYGQELGIGPVSAMMGIHIIEGKPAPSGNLIAARIRASGRYDYRVREHSDTACRIEFFELAQNGQRESLGTIEWTTETARRAELAGKTMWKKYPRNMLFNRAISEGARVYCPEIFGGAPVYTPEELGAEVDEDGNPVQEAVVVASRPVGEEQPARTEYHDRLLATIKSRAAELPDGFAGEAAGRQVDDLKAELRRVWPILERNVDAARQAGKDLDAAHKVLTKQRREEKKAAKTSDSSEDALQRLRGQYFATLKEKHGEVHDADRHAFQEAVTGKASTSDWGVGDYEAAIAAVEAGKMEDFALPM